MTWRSGECHTLAVSVWCMDIKANCTGSEAKARAFAAAGMNQPLLVCARSAMAWLQLGPSSHFLRWEAKVRMWGMKRLPWIGHRADFSTSWSLRGLLWEITQLKLRRVVEVEWEKLASKPYAWKRLPFTQATSCSSSSSRERLNGQIWPFIFFPGCLSFTTCPFHPGRRRPSISQANLAYEGSCSPGSLCWCSSPAVCLSILKKSNAASEQGEKHIMGQISSAAGQDSSNTSWPSVGSSSMSVIHASLGFLLCNMAGLKITSYFSPPKKQILAFQTLYIRSKAKHLLCQLKKEDRTSHMDKLICRCQQPHTVKVQQDNVAVRLTERQNKSASCALGYLHGFRAVPTQFCSHWLPK